MTSRLTAAREAVFNAANLNGGAATILSHSMGSDIGTYGFAAAVLIGTGNKYFAQINEGRPLYEVLKDAMLSRNIENRYIHKMTEFLSRPQFTAEVFMASAAINAGFAVYDVVAMPDQTLSHAFRAGAWGMGLAGDSALRQLDKINFNQVLKTKDDKGSRLSAAYRSAAANPDLYYIWVNGCYALSALVDTSQKLNLTETAVNYSVTGVAGLGSLWVLRNAWRAASNKIKPEKINDGVINGCTVAAQSLLGVFMAMVGNYQTASAQGIFAVSSVNTLFETRKSNARRGLTTEEPAPVRTEIPVQDPK